MYTATLMGKEKHLFLGAVAVTYKFFFTIIYTTNKKRNARRNSL